MTIEDSIVDVDVGDSTNLHSYLAEIFYVMIDKIRVEINVASVTQIKR